MRVDNVLILAAGKGTRMGEIGKVLPKVIWPIFNKSILELEVEYAKRFSPKKVYVNLYNSKEKIKNFVRDKAIFNNVEFIEEDKVLDIGGAVHNIAKNLGYKGSLLIINSDQFIILSEEKIEEFERKVKKEAATLLVYSVDPKGGYGGLRLSDDRIVGLIDKKDSKKEKNLITYTGMSHINLEKLKNVQGKSNFFKTVINFNEVNPNFVNVDCCEYWDFGTLERYKNSMSKLLKSDDAFKDFLEESGVKISNLKNIDERFSFERNKLVFKN